MTSRPAGRAPGLRESCFDLATKPNFEASGERLDPHALSGSRKPMLRSSCTPEISFTLRFLCPLTQARPRDLMKKHLAGQFVGNGAWKR